MMQVAGVIHIDARDSTPIYAQIERALRAAIATGRLKPGDQLPTVRQLAVDLQVNANTVARVYTDLERNGVLETRRGVGSFISTTPSRARPRDEHLRRLRALVTKVLSDAAREGFTIAELLDALTERHAGDDARVRKEQ
jgi:GntR family transcriptional regulator